MRKNGQKRMRNSERGGEENKVWSGNRNRVREKEKCLVLLLS
jgi:hypothetical protein